MEQKQQKEVAKQLGQLFSNLLANAALGLALSLIVSLITALVWHKLLGHTEPRPDWVKYLSNGIVATAIVADPVGTWINNHSIRAAAIKFIAVYAAFYALQVSIVALIDGGASATHLLLLVPAILLPLVFAGPAVKRFIADKEANLTSRTRAAALEYLASSGPIVYFAMLSLSMAMYWLTAMPTPILLAFVTSCALGMIAYCAWGYDLSTPPLDGSSEVTFERPVDISEALANISAVALKVLPGCLCLTGLIWISFRLSGALYQAEALSKTTDPLELLYFLALSLGAPIVALFCGLAAMAIVASLIIGLSTRWKGETAEQGKQRMSKLSEMIYGGSMSRIFHASLKPSQGSPEK